MRTQYDGFGLGGNMDARKILDITEISQCVRTQYNGFLLGGHTDARNTLAITEILPEPMRTQYNLTHRSQSDAQARGDTYEPFRRTGAKDWRPRS